MRFQKGNKFGNRFKKGYKQTEKIRKKLRVAWEKRRLVGVSEETKMKLSIAHKGKKFSEEHKRKMSENHADFSGENHPQWNGGRIVKKFGYIYIYKNNHPYSSCNYVLEHRLVAEKYLRRYLTKSETIHHINEIKTDNRPENLYLFETSGKHTGFHNLKNKPMLKSNILNQLNTQ